MTTTEQTSERPCGACGQMIRKVHDPIRGDLYVTRDGRSH